MVSPTTENRKCPGPIMPACTWPDRDLVHPGPLHRAERVRAVPPRRTPAAQPASASIGYQPLGQWKCRTSRRGSGWSTGVMPNRSRISRSNRPAGNDSPARLGSSGRAGSSGTCSSTRRSGPAAVSRYTARKLVGAAVAVVVPGDHGHPEALLQQRQQPWPAARRDAPCRRSGGGRREPSWASRSGVLIALLRVWRRPAAAGRPAARRRSRAPRTRPARRPARTAVDGASGRGAVAVPGASNGVSGHRAASC